MDRKRANKTTSDVPSLRIFGQCFFPSRWKNSSWVIGHVRNFPTIRITKAKWFLTESETLLNQTKPPAAATVKAGEKIHTMGYNEIMVQVGGETTNSLPWRFGSDFFWEFLEVKNISENANVCHATCWWWRIPKQPTTVSMYPKSL